MRILIVTPIFPKPALSGAATRIRNLVRALGTRHELHMLALATEDQVDANWELEGLHEPAELVLAQRNYSLREKLRSAIHPPQWRQTATRIADRFLGLPQRVSRAYYPQLTQHLRDRLAREEYDVVQLEFTEMGRYVPLVRRHAPQARVVLEELDITYVSLSRHVEKSDGLENLGLRMEVARMIRFEHRLWPQCNAIVAMSDIDREEIGRFLPDGSVWTVPNGVDPDYFSFDAPRGSSRRLLFLGYFEHPPNVTGLQFFLKKVWPRLRDAVPNVGLDVVGGAPPPEIRRLDGKEGIRVHGFLEDVRPLMHTCRVMVVPILHGGGTRLKVLEAFAAGLPVVSTRMGCEGIKVKDGVDTLLADTPEEFLRSLSKVLDDLDLAHLLAGNARALIEAEYTWNCIGRKMEEVWQGADSRAQ